MKTWNIPARIGAFIFDVDSTLYTHKAFAASQIDGQIARLAERRGQSPEAMKAELDSWRETWSRSHGGKKISLGNTFREFGVTIEESIAWRTELIRPESWLSADTRLRDTLTALGRTSRLGVVTNNPVAVSRRILASLGVSDCFSSIVGLDSLSLSKPHRNIFLRSARELGTEPDSCVAVGDRYDIDVALPLELGMGGVLVDGVEDVYRLVDLP